MSIREAHAFFCHTVKVRCGNDSTGMAWLPESHVISKDSAQVQSMEVAHMRAAEELENLYERKLALERERHAEARTQLEDLQLTTEDTIAVERRAAAPLRRRRRGR